MIYAGNCLIADMEDYDLALKTAKALKGHVEFFRVKVLGGGTSIEKYKKGIGRELGISMLKEFNQIMPTGTEIHVPEDIYIFNELSFLWIGARNCMNYSLREQLVEYPGKVLIKRGFGMTTEELTGMYDIMKYIIRKNIYPVERGINSFDKCKEMRWKPDLGGAIRLKKTRPDIFNDLIVDCSHSVENPDYVEDCYNAFKAIGVKHFMFECSVDGKSKTDKVISVEKLIKIIGF